MPPSRKNEKQHADNCYRFCYRTGSKTTVRGGTEERSVAEKYLLNRLFVGQQSTG